MRTIAWSWFLLQLCLPACPPHTLQALRIAWALFTFLFLAQCHAHSRLINVHSRLISACWIKLRSKGNMPVPVQQVPKAGAILPSYLLLSGQLSPSTLEEEQQSKGSQETWKGEAVLPKMEWGAWQNQCTLPENKEPTYHLFTKSWNSRLNTPLGSFGGGCKHTSTCKKCLASCPSHLSPPQPPPLGSAALIQPKKGRGERSIAACWVTLVEPSVSNRGTGARSVFYHSLVYWLNKSLFSWASVYPSMKEGGPNGSLGPFPAHSL